MSPRGSGAGIAVGLIVVVALVGLLAFLLARGVGLERSAPPIEELTFERIELPAPNLIRLHVTNGGVDPVTVHQAIVDDAVWSFTIEPGPTIGRLRGATVDIPYPWVEGDAHHIELISRNGVAFAAEIAVAIETPSASLSWLARLGLLGLYVGVVPVALGLATYPLLARLGRRGIDFLLALTVGLLVFLAIDTLGEALELAAEAAGGFHATVLVWIVGIGTLVGLLAFTGRRRRQGELGPLALSFFIALGIGLHNLGEGLAIGSALATGAIGLGTFLVVGFTLHNITEGIGIAAPLLRGGAPRLRHFAGYALLAGGPAILGCWIGGMVFDPFWAAVFLAVGTGAIVQVVVEVGRLLAVGRPGVAADPWRGELLAGAAVGVMIMYATALLVPA
jgi:zinc transporter ZupT